MIKMNIAWEQTRYLASMLVNVNVGKKSAMIAPDKLFPLPQDVYLEKGKPKSTEAEYRAFVDKINKIKSKA